MSTVINVDAVYAAVDLADLKLDLPDEPTLQAKVVENFPHVFDLWADSAVVDPYDILAIDGVADKDGPCIPSGVIVSDERGRDIFSACAHTIRSAIERTYGQDPCSSRSDLTF